MQLKRPGSTAAPAVVQRAPALNPTRGTAPNGECFPAPSVGREARPTAPGAGAVPRSTAWFRLSTSRARSPLGERRGFGRPRGGRGTDGFQAAKKDTGGVRLGRTPFGAQRGGRSEHPSGRRASPERLAVLAPRLGVGVVSAQRVWPHQRGRNGHAAPARRAGQEILPPLGRRVFRRLGRSGLSAVPRETGRLSFRVMEAGSSTGDWIDAAVTYRLHCAGDWEGDQEA